MYGPNNYVGSVDATLYYIIALSLFFLVLVTGLMIYFAVHYNRKRHPLASQIEGNTTLEIAWTVIPLVLVMSMFYLGFKGFHVMRHPPGDAMTVRVTGRQWQWSFRYENGKESVRLFVPVGRPIKLTMTSADVIHDFYIPAFRIKEDVLPGRETYLWFKPQTTGPADVFCSQYCGLQHAYMMSEVVVLPPVEFATWYAAPAETLKGSGAAVLLSKYGCLECHSLDGTAGIGPTFHGLYGSTVDVLVGGRAETRVADEAYLRRAVRDPSAEYVVGYERNMPAPVLMTDDDLGQIVEYLRTLK
jgi:cytochrome c oxidase subunit II